MVLTDDTSVPKGVPISGSYTGTLRPQVHFSPPREFMNDPNGMFKDAKGVWHLYYQYNPTDTVAGNQHWGHATSKDLYHWVNQPIALFPDKKGDGIFSGSAVIDVNNTSGFFTDQKDGVVAIYTLNTDQEQTQEIAYSKDGGYSFTKYANNPVISINSTQFRDPKVIWHAPTSRWVMVIAYVQEYSIGIYTSPNLKDWTHASNFSHRGLLGLQYECPNLVPIPMQGTTEQFHLLAISVNPGAPLGGSTTQYFPGHFNGTHFTPVDDAARLADFGKDNYAGQFFFGTPDNEPPVGIAWASNWEYSQVVPTGPLEDWRSSMALPRVYELANATRRPFQLISKPYDLTPLHTSQLVPPNSPTANATVRVDYSHIPSGALHFRASISHIPTANAAGTANFTIYSSSFSSTDESLRGGFFLAASADTLFWLDRSRAARRFPDNPFFTDKFSTSTPIRDSGVWSLEAVFDRSILDVFLDDGVQTATLTCFPDARLDVLEWATEGLNEGVEVSVEAWGLESGWTGE
ncbi:hypothetical protein GP486_007659 [Trichoglossum hirsutum]|uniref:Beta-fructofuranosidase n=1 Tax=Trichoglossum hirsutum TaxID=265104 RepID=A0A9P8L7J7_9PEZI|nr:hypothetical protein GP486_007659 [Trichoglossum hirsutum]